MRNSSGVGSGIGWRDYLFAPRIVGVPDSDSSAGSRLNNQYLLLAFRLILAGVFIYAGFQKIGKPLMFADEIRMYGVLDRGAFLYTVAVVLPWIEILCGISMITGIFLRGSALLLVILNAWFLVIVTIRTIAIMSTQEISFTHVYFDCGCGFGVTYAWKKLLEDSSFFVFSLWLFLAPAYRFVFVPIRRKL